MNRFSTKTRNGRRKFLGNAAGKKRNIYIYGHDYLHTSKSSTKIRNAGRKFLGNAAGKETPRIYY